MKGCCGINADLAKKKRLLQVVLTINLIMFVIQFIAAWFAHSTTLLADSLDMLGDSLTYGLSLYAVGKGVQWLNRAAIAKAIIILLFAVVVFIEAVLKILSPVHETSYRLMIIFGVLGLIANGVCFYLLTRQRDEDINLRSAWICSKNDLIGNVAVIVTAILVAIFQSRWPDIIIGLMFVIVLIWSSVGIMKDVKKNKSDVTQ